MNSSAIASPENQPIYLPAVSVGLFFGLSAWLPHLRHLTLPARTCFESERSLDLQTLHTYTRVNMRLTASGYSFFVIAIACGKRPFY
jgi:hypothetical protein